jgi:HlyD family secretion protein
MKPAPRLRPLLPALALLLIAGCKPGLPPEEQGWLPGYLEADVIEIASSEPGTLATLDVRRGQRVARDAPLFTLDATPLRQELAAMQARRAAADKRAADAALGERDETIRRISADLAAAREALNLARIEQARQAALLREAVATQAQTDAANSAAKQQEEHVRSLEASLELARKGQRPLQVDALAAEAAALAATTAQLEWRVAQTSRAAPADAFVEDTLREPDEWVPAGRPVVLLRRADDLHVRCFLPPDRVAALRKGDTLEVRPPGDGPLLRATVSRIADQAEFTPPVIYSREESERLVILVEADLAPADAERLHPGLPVTVRPPSPAAP